MMVAGLAALAMTACISIAVVGYDPVRLLPADAMEGRSRAARDGSVRRSPTRLCRPDNAAPSAACCFGVLP